MPFLEHILNAAMGKNQSVAFQTWQNEIQQGNHHEKVMSLLNCGHKRPKTQVTEHHFCDVRYAQRVFDFVLEQLYPCICSCGEICTTRIRNRPYILRCQKCLKQKSKLAHTPFRNLRLPQWMLGWLIEESYIRHPKVVTAAEIQRRLGVSCKTSLVMKRRMQVFASEQMEKVKTLIWKQMEKEFKDFLLPPDGTDITSIAARKKIVHADTVALWSCSVRANQGRKRWKHGGLTSSIYMSDKLGGRQIGTLVNVMGTQQGWCLLHSIPNQKADTLGPIIKEHLPMSTGIFTDQGYDWLYRVYRNHRMINHSRKSPDNRFRFARDRWSRNGVHNQVSEALNSSLKAEMQAYRYFKPENSTLYLNEWSFFKNLRYFGLAKIADRRLKRKSRCVDSSADIGPTR